MSANKFCSYPVVTSFEWPQTVTCKTLYQQNGLVPSRHPGRATFDLTYLKPLDLIYFKPFDLTYLQPFDLTYLKSFDLTHLKLFDLTYLKPLDLTHLKPFGLTTLNHST